VSQRTGDTVFLKQILFNYNVQVDFNDVFDSVRVIMFQWYPNSGLVAPIVADILQTASVSAFYNWQLSSQYSILYDKVHFMAGVATSPTSSSNQGFYGEISMKNVMRRVEFTAGSAFGSGELFLLVISDSSLVPNPAYTGRTRVIYCED